MERREFLKKTMVTGAAFAGAELTGFAMPMPVEALGTGGGIDVEEGLYLLELGEKM